MKREKTKRMRSTARTAIMRRLRIDPSKPLPQPNLKPPERPRLLGEPVLNQIASACDLIRREMDIPWSGNILRTTLRSYLTEFEAASMLVQRVIVRDRWAETEFRAWLAGAASRSRRTKRHEISLERIKKDLSGVRPFNLDSLDTFRALFVGAVMIAHDENDLNNLIRGIDACFARAKWGESLYQAAQNFEQTGDAHSFASRLRMFGRMTGMGPGRYGYSGNRPPGNRSPIPDWEREMPGGGFVPGRPGALPPDLGPDWPPPDREERFKEYLEELEPPLNEVIIYLEYAYSVLRHLATETHVHLRSMYYPIPADSDYLLSDNITDITPRHTCGGQPIIITGYNFGQPQPEGICLVFPFHIPGELSPSIPRRVSRIAEVPDSPDGYWDDNEIKLPCPEWARYGPVGFLDMTALEIYADAAQFVGDVFFEGTADGASHRLRDLMETGRMCGALGTGLPVVAIIPLPVFPCPPLTDHNLFKGTTPEIEISPGSDGHIALEPDGEVVISWRVIGATSDQNSINIKLTDSPTLKIGAQWPMIDEEHMGGEIIEGSLVLAFSLTADGDWVYTFTAVNECGTVTKDLTIHIRRPTQVTIYGIEVNQAIQSFNKDDPSLTNAIPLVEGKQFFVRVYAGSGWPNDYALTPMGQMQLGQVTATMDIIPLSGQSWYQVLNYPLLPVGQEVGLPCDDFVEHRDPSVKFYPWFGYATGTVQIKIRLSSNDPWATWEPVEESITVEFQQTNSIKLHIFEVVDKYGVGPSPIEIDTCLEKLRAIFPVSNVDGIQDVAREVLRTDLDLNDEDDWFHYSPFSQDLFDVLDEAAEEITDDDVIPCGIVSHLSRDKVSGRGWPGGLTKNRLAYWRADLEGNSFIEAHEIGHAFNLFHTEGDIFVRGNKYGSSQVLPSTTDAMMVEVSSERWIDPAEYLHMMGWEFLDIIAYCNQKGLDGHLNIWYF